jgi:hypothetical protein
VAQPRHRIPSQQPTPRPGFPYAQSPPPTAQEPSRGSRTRGSRCRSADRGAQESAHGRTVPTMRRARTGAPASVACHQPALTALMLRAGDRMLHAGDRPGTGWPCARWSGIRTTSPSPRTGPIRGRLRRRGSGPVGSGSIGVRGPPHLTLASRGAGAATGAGSAGRGPRGAVEVRRRTGQREEGVCPGRESTDRLRWRAGPATRPNRQKSTLAISQQGGREVLARRLRDQPLPDPALHAVRYRRPTLAMRRSAIRSNPPNTVRARSRATPKPAAAASRRGRPQTHRIPPMDPAENRA